MRLLKSDRFLDVCLIDLGGDFLQFLNMGYVNPWIVREPIEKSLVIENMEKGGIWFEAKIPNEKLTSEYLRNPNNWSMCGKESFKS